MKEEGKESDIRKSRKERRKKGHYDRHEDLE